MELSATSELLPVYGERNVAVVCSTSDEYALYAGVMIASLIRHASAEWGYDIIVLEERLSEERKRLLKELELLAGTGNVSIRMCHVEGMAEELLVKSGFAKETYFRLLLPTLFADYDKLLYLDVDMVVQSDVAQLYHTELGDMWVGACRDAAQAAMQLWQMEQPDYYRNELQLNPLEEYFNAGVLLLNLRRMREQHVPRLFMEALATLPEPRWMDQDILNMVCRGHVLYLNTAWNRLPKYSCLKNDFSPELQGAFAPDAAIPGIIHYLGPTKPWICPNINGNHDEWWTVAQGAPFYVEICRMAELPAQQWLAARKARRPRIWLQYAKYRLFALLALGKKRSYCRARVKSLKAYLQEDAILTQPVL